MSSLKFECRQLRCYQSTFACLGMYSAPVSPSPSMSLALDITPGVSLVGSRTCPGSLDVSRPHNFGAAQSFGDSGITGINVTARGCVDGRTKKRCLGRHPPAPSRPQPLRGRGPPQTIKTVLEPPLEPNRGRTAGTGRGVAIDSDCVFDAETFARDSGSNRSKESSALVAERWPS